MNGRGTLLIALALLILALAFFFVPECAAQEPVTITVRDFGRGMEPGLNPYANDPEAIVYSTNFYSTVPGTRQLRFGMRGVFSDSIAASDSAIKSLIHFQPRSDSSAFVYAAGGRWFSNHTGRWYWGSIVPGFDWKGAISSAAEVRPFQEGTDSIATDADSVVGTNTRFFRDYQVGDKIIVGTTQPDTQTVLHIVSDTKLWIEGTWDSVGTWANHRASRSFQTAAADPFLHQSGDMVYTGTPSDHPQVIYTDENDTLRIRPLKIVDSVYVDAAYYKVTDSVRGNSLAIDDPDTVITYFEVVDRSKDGNTWGADYWGEDIHGNPASYYFWLGGSGTDTAYMPHTFRIIGSTDSSLRLECLFVDGELADSPRVQYALTVADTLADGVLDGTVGYICAAVGQLKTVIPNSSTGSVDILEGGLIWRTESNLISAANIDTLNYGNHYIHLLESVSLGPEDSTGYRTVPRWGRCDNPDLWDIPDYDTETEVIVSMDVSRDTSYLGGVPVEVCTIVWTIKSVGGFAKKGGIGERYFKISHVLRDEDTTFFVTTGPYDLGADTITVTEWEIVKAEMPYWGGMNSFERRLVAWGDSLSGARINMSRSDRHWDWTQIDDGGAVLEFTVGANASDIIRFVLPYDDRMIFFLQNSMVGYPGFTELSRTLSVVGPKAAMVYDKWVYWAWVDGIYRMDRRDFSGYSSKKISRAMDPVFNNWNTTVFGADVVPFGIAEADRPKTVLAYNQRDNHLYVFHSQTNCLTYDIDRQIWDGHFDIAATDAIWATKGDTSSIIIGSPDSAALFALDYAFADVLSPYDGDIKSKKFWLTDQGGYPLESRLRDVRFVSRSLSGGLDTSYVNIIGDSATTTVALSHNAAMSDAATKFWAQDHNTSVYWRWQLKTEGSASANAFFPIELNMTFVPVRRDK